MTTDTYNGLVRLSKIQVRDLLVKLFMELETSVPEIEAKLKEVHRESMDINQLKLKLISMKVTLVNKLQEKMLEYVRILLQRADEHEYPTEITRFKWSNQYANFDKRVTTLIKEVESQLKQFHVTSATESTTIRNKARTENKENEYRGKSQSSDHAQFNSGKYIMSTANLSYTASRTNPCVLSLNESNISNKMVSGEMRNTGGNLSKTRGASMNISVSETENMQVIASREVDIIETDNPLACCKPNERFLLDLERFWKIHPLQIFRTKTSTISLLFACSSDNNKQCLHKFRKNLYKYKRGFATEELSSERTKNLCMNIVGQALHEHISSFHARAEIYGLLSLEPKSPDMFIYLWKPVLFVLSDSRSKNIFNTVERSKIYNIFFCHILTIIPAVFDSKAVNFKRNLVSLLAPILVEDSSIIFHQLQKVIFINLGAKENSLNINIILKLRNQDMINKSGNEKKQFDLEMWSQSVCFLYFVLVLVLPLSVLEKSNNSTHTSIERSIEVTLEFLRKILGNITSQQSLSSLEAITVLRITRCLLNSIHDYKVMSQTRNISFKSVQNLVPIVIYTLELFPDSNKTEIFPVVFLLSESCINDLSSPTKLKRWINKVFSDRRKYQKQFDKFPDLHFFYLHIIKTTLNQVHEAEKDTFYKQFMKFLPGDRVPMVTRIAYLELLLNFKKRVFTPTLLNLISKEILKSTNDIIKSGSRNYLEKLLLLYFHDSNICNTIVSTDQTEILNHTMISSILSLRMMEALIKEFGELKLDLLIKVLENSSNRLKRIFQSLESIFGVTNSIALIFHAVEKDILQENDCIKFVHTRAELERSHISSKYNFLEALKQQSFRVYIDKFLSFSSSLEKVLSGVRIFYKINIENSNIDLTRKVKLCQLVERLLVQLQLLKQVLSSSANPSLISNLRTDIKKSKLARNRRSTHVLLNDFPLLILGFESLYAPLGTFGITNKPIIPTEEILKVVIYAFSTYSYLTHQQATIVAKSILVRLQLTNNRSCPNNQTDIEYILGYFLKLCSTSDSILDSKSDLLKLFCKAVNMGKYTSCKDGLTPKLSMNVTKKFGSSFVSVQDLLVSKIKYYQKDVETYEIELLSSLGEVAENLNIVLQLNTSQYLKESMCSLCQKILIGQQDKPAIILHLSFFTKVLVVIKENESKLSNNKKTMFLTECLVFLRKILEYKLLLKLRAILVKNSSLAFFCAILKNNNGFGFFPNNTTREVHSGILQ
eukprot:snap_masked-scaffold_34-processed-gene-0.54-mRNA-1 protein AED:1.00 eAED:1.00 QI:0/0/0/0/1/1/2/0/1227